MGGGRDRGKFNKRGGRGGGRSFQAESAAEIELRNERLAQFDQARSRRRADAEDDSDDGSDAEVEDVKNEVSNISLGGEGDNEDEQNTGERPMTRRERENAEKERKAAEYRRLHQLGLTDEYKRDMEKLAEVKKRREQAEAKAKADKEGEEALEKERKLKAEAAGAFSDDKNDEKKKKKSKKKDSDVPKLDKITIKKMKPTQLKEALKARKLDIQGNAKALTQRLLDYEASR
mmetsp:Transcript_10579/g.14928  ORF Transcript_10579/g.14928 Transcript_10579/m.14928 type:complete len:232 (-) Transcript_10579:243-938(-)|eukprot:CAMPEP_0184866036 /NCGR_PEP_ID=MMETSP0580-20130426/20385_1 /TAXON_ID=1118495 /ORGANISM="Dactyliosolen fragilissimus" /LENGTH=231 /DNA_ID=CAMNT_0027365479 /DNA_START=94 /DNA_END=789 /DNA_ORIENTATION=+